MNKKIDKTLLCDAKVDNILLYLKEAVNFPGATAEMGVYKGGISKLIAENNNGKLHYAFDTFEGIINVGDNDNDILDRFNKVNYKAVCELLSADNIRIIKGYFPDTVSKYEMPLDYCFVHFDGDTYQSMIDSIDYFIPRLVPGGIMIIDDYNRNCCKGIKTAINEKGIQVTELRKGQGLYIKPCR